MKFCKTCGKKLNDHQYKYCSMTCQHVDYYNIYIDKWKRGEATTMRGKHAISCHIRKFLFEKYDFKCCKCGWGDINASTNKTPLEVHHVDGDYTNNTEENLELLCPNCHSLTSTYKSLNYGNGRENRHYFYNGELVQSAEQGICNP